MPRDDPRRREPDLAYNAPLLAVDLAAFRDDGSAFEIWPCLHCLPWHAEVIHLEFDDPDSPILVREWHAAECPELQRLLDQPDGSDTT